MSPPRGRGAADNPPCRYHQLQVVPVAAAPDEPLRTQVREERTGRLITTNRSPDIPFERSINPYRGCEHGCIYCYARPSHAWLGLSPGLDFETRLVARIDAPEALARELNAPGYQPAPIALGTFTDPYQPVERRMKITRRLLELFLRLRHPLTLTTRSALVERDLDLLGELARLDLVQVNLSIPTLDEPLSRAMEPRAPRPARRLAALSRLAEAGIPTCVMVAPVIPMLSDHTLEKVLQAAAQAGARQARMQLVRLPAEVEALFERWLEEHYPDRARRVMARIRDCHGGRTNDNRFGRRLGGQGPFADLIRQRFQLAARRLGLDRPLPPLDTSRFRGGDPQLPLF